MENQITLAQKRCSRCGDMKDASEFKSHGNQCRDCHNEYRREEMHVKYIEKYVEEGFIKPNELFSAVLLLKSCRSRWEACKHDSGIYKDIKCDYPTYKDFFYECLKNKGFFARWHELSEIYKASQDENDRPNIDRINSDLHYTVDNIRPMTKRLNTFLATAEPIIFVLHEQDKLKKVVKGMFDSKADLKAYIEQHYPSVHAPRFVDKAIQAVGEREGENISFEYGDKDYYLQTMLIDKLSDYYQARIERMVLQHIGDSRAKLNLK